MNAKKLLKLMLFMALSISLSACNTISIKEDNEQPAVDLLTLRKQADEAYLNDDLETSEKHYETLIKEMPAEAIHWYRLGNIYARTNRPAAAINLYREAVIRDPKLSEAWYNLGIVQLKQTAYNLNEMLIYTDRMNPLYSKAASMLEDIKAIIRND